MFFFSKFLQDLYLIIKDQNTIQPPIVQLDNVDEDLIDRPPSEIDLDELELIDSLLFYPEAIITEGQKSQGLYKKEYPEGAIIHYTAGRQTYKGRKQVSSGQSAMNYSIKQNKYAYFVIGADGTVHQSLPLNEYGWHAGKAYHPFLDSTRVSSRCVGIEITAAGKVEPLSTESDTYKSSYGEIFNESEVRESDEDTKNKGFYHKFTKEQEVSLQRLLKWLHSNNPEVFSYDNVLGHDEVSIGRKQDPGASLSTSVKTLVRQLEQS